MKRPLLTALALSLLAPGLTAAPAKSPSKPAAKPKPKPAPKPAARPKSTPVPASPNGATRPEPVAQAPIEIGPKTWAVLVGVSEYQTAGIQGLNFPAKDASGLRDALIDSTLGGIPSKQVLLLTNANATRDKIMGAVDTFLRPNVEPGDKVIVFLAGHGVAKGAGLDAKSYFLPTDVRGLTTAAFDSSAVPLRALSDSLGTLPASQFVVFVDACREDPTPGRGFKGNTLSDVLSRGLTVVPKDENAQSATFFACSVGERAYEDEKYGHGVFTNWILEGLRQGNVAQKPDGAVDMSLLSTYVEGKVASWAKERSSSGDFEVTQTPELISSTELKKDLVLLKVRRQYSDNPIAPSSPRLMVAVFPEGAQVSINGVRAGVGTVEQKLPTAGDYTVTVSAPGYAPVSRSVSARGGFQSQLTVQLQPTANGVAAPIGDQATDFYKRADEAMARQQWEIAEQGYKAAIGANPKFGAPYEAIADLHRLENRNLDTIADALGLLVNSPRSAHPLALVSRSYSQYAVKGPGEGNITTKISAVANYGLPKKPDDATKLAVRAASEAVTAEPASSEAYVAQGYALAALDTKAKNKTAALAAWGKAAFMDPTNAACHLGLGYGIRYYVSQDKKMKDDEKSVQLNRAVAALNQAVQLRPNYYEAHRELAFCYMALENTQAALSECGLARANRGAASDINEIASIEIAMSGLHQKAAQSSTGEAKTENEAASEGYLAEAKETAPNADLKIALSILGGAGVSTSIGSYLPSEVQDVLNTFDDFKSRGTGAVVDKIRGRFGL